MTPARDEINSAKLTDQAKNALMFNFYITFMKIK